MKQVKEELEKGKAVEARRTKEVAQLRKEQVRKEGLIDPRDLFIFVLIVLGRY